MGDHTHGSFTSPLLVDEKSTKKRISLDESASKTGGIDNPAVSFGGIDNPAVSFGGIDNPAVTYINPVPIISDDESEHNVILYFFVSFVPSAYAAYVVFNNRFSNQNVM